MEDHGGSPGALREGKFFTFEGGMRIPAIVQWTGKIQKGQVYRKPAAQMDWFPTFARISGIELPADRPIDGKDLSQVLFMNGERGDDSFLFMEGRSLQGYRQGDWKVKLPFKGFEGADWKQAVAAHDTLLFNLKKDPGEKDNLFYAHKELARELITEMNARYTNLGKLPPTLITQSPEDKSHFEYLLRKHAK
jgi:arylsulfatase A-like enzyme